MGELNCTIHFRHTGVRHQSTYTVLCTVTTAANFCLSSFSIGPSLAADSLQWVSDLCSSSCMQCKLTAVFISPNLNQARLMSICVSNRLKVESMDFLLFCCLQMTAQRQQQLLQLQARHSWVVMSPCFHAWKVRSQRQAFLVGAVQACRCAHSHLPTCSLFHLLTVTKQTSDMPNLVLKLIILTRYAILS